MRLRFVFVASLYGVLCELVDEECVLVYLRRFEREWVNVRSSPGTVMRVFYWSEDFAKESAVTCGSSS